MRSIRWAGLMSSLLIVGVVGGLMAPFPSEAGFVTAPTVAAQVDPCGGGNFVSIAAISKVNPGVVTTNGPHGFSTGDKIYIDCVTGMTQVNGRVFTITSVTTNSFSLGVDTTSYITYVTGGSASKAISSATISGISKANPGVVTTSASHGLVTGDKIFIDGVAGMTQVNNLFFTITLVDATHFTLGANTTGYDTWTSGGNARKYVSPPINLPLTACTDAEVASLAPGFTSCFFVPTNQIFSSAGTTRRYFKIVDVNWPACSPTPCGRPILKVADTSSGLDAFQYTQYVFTPVQSSGAQLVSPYWGTALNPKPNIGTPGSSPPYYGETHSMRLTFNHTFDFAGNNKSVCTNYSDPATCSALYQIALSISGTMAGGGGGTASGDYVRLSGTGNFGPTAGWRNLLMPNNSGGPCSDPNSRNSPLDVLYCPLQRQLGVAATTPSSFSDLPDLRQDDGSAGAARYPSYICDRSPTGSETIANSCKPQVTFSVTTTVRGPDAVLLPGSFAVVGGGCTVTNNKGGTLTPQGPPCFSNSKKGSLTDTTTKFFTEEENANLQYFASVGAEPTEACVGDQCICANPETCSSGTILITAAVTPDASQTFPFLANGSGVDNFSIITAGMPATQDPPCPAEPFGEGCKAFNNVEALYDNPGTFTADTQSLSNPWPIADSTHIYDVDSIDCESALNKAAVYDNTTVPPTLITPAFIVSEWTVDSGSVKTTATVTRLGAGDIVTCNFHIHKTSNN